MKKVLLFAAALVFVAGFTSCLKDYTCKCEYTENGTKKNIDIPMDFETKLLAETQCDVEETTYQMIDANAKCELD